LFEYQLIKIVQVAFNVLTYLVIARILLSFIRHNPYQPVIRFIYEITEPIMAPFRRLIPPVGGIDFSPIILFFVIRLVEGLVIDIIRIIF